MQMEQASSLPASHSDKYHIVLTNSCVALVEWLLAETNKSGCRRIAEMRLEKKTLKSTDLQPTKLFLEQHRFSSRHPLPKAHLPAFVVSVFPFLFLFDTPNPVKMDEQQFVGLLESLMQRKSSTNLSHLFSRLMGYTSRHRACQVCNCHPEQELLLVARFAHRAASHPGLAPEPQPPPTGRYRVSQARQETLARPSQRPKAPDPRPAPAIHSQ